MSSHLGDVPTTLRNSATGQFRIATPAVVCLDLASRPNDAGGLDNVATVLSDLVSETGLVAGDLVGAGAAYPVATLRRLGWLLDLVESAMDLEILRRELTRRAARASRPTALLDPAGVRHGRVNPVWGVVENCSVEPDLCIAGYFGSVSQHETAALDIDHGRLSGSDLDPLAASPTAPTVTVRNVSPILDGKPTRTAGALAPRTGSGAAGVAVGDYVT